MKFLRTFLTIFLLLSSSAVIALSISEEENSLKVTSLMSAVLDGDVQSVEFFSKSDIEKINEKNIGGASALALACRKDNVEIVKILIGSGAAVNNVDNEGWTPLMRAANNGNFEIVELLLAARADVTKLNSEKEGALIHATKSGCINCFNAIFAKFDLTHFLTAEQLKSQLNNAFILAKKQGSMELQNIINTQLGLIVDEAAQDAKLEQDFKIVENFENFPVEEKISKPAKKKNFIFKVSEDKKNVAKEAAKAVESKIQAEKVEEEAKEEAMVRKFILKEGAEKAPISKENPQDLEVENVEKVEPRAMIETNKVKKFIFKTGQEKLQKPARVQVETRAEVQKIQNIQKANNFLSGEENSEKKFIFKKSE